MGRVRCLARITPAVPVLVDVEGAMLKLGPVLGALGHMARLAEQLALGGFFDQVIPRSRQARRYGEVLGRGVDVIELKVLCGSTSNTISTKHLDKPVTPGGLPYLVVAALICRSILDHLRLPQEPER
jgi:hypothetical protein